MSPVAENLQLVLVLLFVKASLVVLIARMWTWKLGRASAASRHAVWATALLVVLLLPLGSFLPYSVRLPVEIPAAGPAAVVGDSPATARDGGAVGVEDDVARSAAEKAAAEKAAVEKSAVERTDGGGTRRTPTFAVRSVAWSGILVAFYAVGAAAVLFRLGLGVVLAWRLAKRARPVSAHGAWRSTAAAVGGLGRSALRVSRDVHAPVTFGALRPSVLLPDAVSSWSADQRRSALIHELAHVDRFDWVVQIFAGVACALYWFHPLVWLAARRLHLEAERACDERVIRAGSDPQQYAQQLVDLTRQSHNRFRVAVAMASRSELSDRVVTILKQGRQQMRSARAWATVAVVITAAGVLTAPLELIRAQSFEFEGRRRPRSERTALMQAAARGDLDGVQARLAAGADVEERREGRGTALILAAAHGHTDVVKVLVEAGADANGAVRDGWDDDVLRTPLAAATRNGHLDIVAYLIDNGARVNAAPPGDATALMEAAGQGHLDLVNLLLEHGARVNRRLDGDGTALIAAARGGDLGIVQRLVDAGADVNAGVPGDGNALIAAVRNDDRRMVEYLLAQGADPNAYVPGDETALIAAAENGATDLMRLMLDASGESRR